MMQDTDDLEDFAGSAAELPRVQALSVAPGSDAAEPIWLQTLEGGAFDLLDPQPEQVNFSHVAQVLARTPRFGGHTRKGVLSVAQHCREGAYAILRDTGRRDWARAFLLHDAHEAYIGDISVPVRDAIAVLCQWSNDFLSALAELKERADHAIYTAAGVGWPLDSETHAVIKAYDVRMCRTERDARMDPAPHLWGEPYTSAAPVQGVDLYPWSEGAMHALYYAALRDFDVDNLRPGR